MHQLLPLKLKIGIIVVLTFSISWITAVFKLHPLAVGTIVSFVEWAVIALMFHSWKAMHDMPRWALKCLPCWVSIDLNGMWTGKIHSQYQERESDAVPTAIDASMEITQSWQEIIFALWTTSMSGESRCACPQYDPLTKKLEIRYFFDTSPTASEAMSNPAQKYGSAIATLYTHKPDEMSIRYTNERGRGGDIFLTRKRSVALKN